jgi:hypothetical protein
VKLLTDFSSNEKWIDFILGASTFLDFLKKKKSEEMLAKHKEVLLKSFSSTIFKQIEVSKPSYWNSFSYLINALNEKEIKDICEILSNGMRRSSETVVPTCLWFVKSLNNYSNHCEVLIPQITEQLMSKNEQQASYASEFCLTVAIKSKSKDVLTSLIKENFQLLKGSGLGANEKIFCLNSIKNFSNAEISTSDLNGVSEQFIYPTLNSLIKQKSNPDQLRCFALETLSCWINKTKNIPDFVESDFSSILDAEKTNLLVIQGLTLFFGDLFSMKPVNKLFNKFTSIISLSEKKIGDRGNAILALRALLKASIEFPESSI